MSVASDACVVNHQLTDRLCDRMTAGIALGILVIVGRDDLENDAFVWHPRLF